MADALTEQMRQLRLELVALQAQLPGSNHWRDPLHTGYNAVVDAADKLAGTLADRGLIDLEAVINGK